MSEEESVHFTEKTWLKVFPCSAELISTAYQSWNSVFFSQQISHSRFISKKQPAEQGYCSLISCERKILFRLEK
jgi:hypothetical protein